jgi:drug/metabolite transporter (DMT)-like permease
VIAALILPRTGFGVFRTKMLSAHIGRSGTQAVAQSALVVALGMLPLAGVVAITFSAPLFATLLAALWLKEKIGLARGSALVIGFLGVLLVAAPDANSFQMGALFALTNAVLLGSVTAAVRGMTKTESTETLTMYQMVILVVIFGLGLPLFGFTWPVNTDWLPLLINGVFNGLGQYWWTRALSMAPPAAVGPFSYFSIVWAVLLGFLIWGDVPTIALIAGAAIVVASGLFLLWHESNKKTQPMSAGESLPD